MSWSRMEPSSMSWKHWGRRWYQSPVPWQARDTRTNNRLNMSILVSIESFPRHDTTISQSLENLLCQTCEQKKYHHRSWHEQYMQRFSSHELTFSNYNCLCMGSASAGPSGRLKRFESHRNWESCPAQPAETWRQNKTCHINYINMFWCTLNKVEAFQTRHFKIEIQSKQIFEYKTIQDTSEIWYLYNSQMHRFWTDSWCKKSSSLSLVQKNELWTYCNCV